MCGFLEQIAGSSRLLGLNAILRTHGNAEDQDFRRGEGLVNEAGCGEAIHDWHPDIHEHEIRMELPGPREGFLPITSLADDRQVWFAGKQESQACPNPLVIIYDEDPSRRRW